ncbi:hypothetical protein [Lysobacter gummosus]|uniref:hypothetical protein n=1 Tax=Lysobacter gummosus TaxID=262324 RepID=UPI00362BFBAF
MTEKPVAQAFTRVSSYRLNLTLLRSIPTPYRCDGFRLSAKRSPAASAGVAPRRRPRSGRRFSWKPSRRNLRSARPEPRTLSRRDVSETAPVPPDLDPRLESVPKPIAKR